MQLEPRPLTFVNAPARFSILIPTWNNLEHLQLCIRSIRQNSAADHQVIVHVNDGRDGTLEWVRSQGLDHTYSAQNIGICLAVNEATALADAEWIVYMNDDMYCCPDWDVRLMNRVRMIGHDGFMLSGTMVEPVATGNQCVQVADFGRDVQGFQESALLQALPGLHKPDWSGSTWPPTLVHSRWWHAVGAYSSEFSPGMASDNDFAMKMWAAGCRVFLGVGDSLVYHFMCKSTGRISKNNGRKQFLRKWRMTPSLFDRFYLRRGATGGLSPLEDPAQQPGFARARRWSRLKAWLA